jgi:excisionase family DNA binding protein
MGGAMSVATERRAMRDALAGHSLMSIPEAARLLDCSEPVVRRMVEDRIIPSVPVGRQRKLDPIDVAVHILAGREDLSAAEFWRTHGEATPDLARRYVDRIIRARGA